jgi:DNA-binding transcriptional ArsR family regulator
MVTGTAPEHAGSDDGPSSGLRPADGDALARFVERFAVTLTEAGWPRMPARVFACLLADEQGGLTAGELAARLQVSPAAISGAVRYLRQVGLVTREREPGARSDHYRVDENVWYESLVQRAAQLHGWEAALADGVDAAGADTRAGRRLDESREFFAFLRTEFEQVLERWRAHQPRD